VPWEGFVVHHARRDMKCQVHHRTACRLCGSTRLRKFIEFERMPFTDEFLKPGKAGSEFLADISVHWCEECHSSQTLQDVEVTEYYRDYRYTVSSSAFARRFMDRLAEESFRRFGMRPGDRVLEIGSGDGYQLGAFKRAGARVLGFEPSAELTRAAELAGVPTVQTLFDAEGVDRIPEEMRPAQMILLTYTFDHLPAPKPFLELTRKVLDPARGVLLIEVHDLAKIVERREICLFEHEHSIYLTALTMKRLLERCGFRLLCDDLLPENERRGNSLLIAAAPAATTTHETTFRDRPIDEALERWETYERFGGDVRAGIARFRGHLQSQRAAGRRVAGYGAGGRGVMTLAMAGVTPNEVEYLCDQNPSFHGLLAPGSHIPVVGPEHAREAPVDELVVFSYAYMDEIRARLSGFAGRFTSILDLM
jgi:SAM-dependent methyltransferase